MPIPAAHSEDAAVHAGSRARAWMAWSSVAMTPVLVASYALLPTDGPYRTIAYPIYGLLATVAIAFALRRRTPIRSRSWSLVAVGVGLLSVGDIIYSVLAVTGAEVPYPSAADVGYIAGYAALTTGALGLVRGHAPGDDRIPLIDAAILAAGAASALWVFLVLPSVSGATDPLATVVSLVYPAMDLLLLAIGARALLGGEARPRHLQLLLAGLACYLLSDVVYAKALLEGSYTFGDAVDLGWIMGVLLMGAAALQPSVGDRIAPTEAGEVGLSKRRLALLTGAAMLAPGLMLLPGSVQQPAIVEGLVASWVFLFGLVLLRLVATVSDLGASLHHGRTLQARLSHQATHDPLTDLANRALFETRLSEALAAPASDTGVIFIDLDDFKAINDALGHGVGDEVLRTLAARLTHVLRDSDIAARLGGDEFAVLLGGCHTEAALRATADRMLAAIRAPIQLADRQLVAHASAGITLGPTGSSALDVMRQADIAMYRAKSDGKDQVGRHVTVLQEALVSEVARPAHNPGSAAVGAG